MIKVWGISLIAAGLTLVAGAAYAQDACVDTDLNGDGVTDAADVEILKAAMGSTEGDANFDAGADFDGDGSVNTIDFGILLSCN